MNKKGIVEIILVGQIALGLIGAIVMAATVETAMNGTLKKHGQVIACIAGGESQGVCNARHGVKRYEKRQPSSAVVNLY